MCRNIDIVHVGVGVEVEVEIEFFFFLARGCFHSLEVERSSPYHDEVSVYVMNGKDQSTSLSPFC